MTEGSCSKHDSDNIRIMIRYCEDIGYLVKLHGSDETDFQENISLQYGCAFSLEQIGEHVKRISSELRDAYPEIDWKGVAGLRDNIAHRYDGIVIPRMRSTVLNEVPS